eukprot:761519-Hanusia_phi.AAC.7
MQVNPNENEPQSADPTAAGIPPWLLPFLVPAAGGALFGYDIGASSALVRILGEKQTLFGTLDPVQLGLVASGSLFGAVAASAALIFVILLLSLQILREEAGARGLWGVVHPRDGVTGCASLSDDGLTSHPQAASSSFGMLIGSRILYGLGIGTAMHAAPLYIAETAPSELRRQPLCSASLQAMLQEQLSEMRGAFNITRGGAGNEVGQGLEECVGCSLANRSGDDSRFSLLARSKMSHVNGRHCVHSRIGPLVVTAWKNRGSRSSSPRCKLFQTISRLRWEFQLSKVSSEEAKIQVNSMTSMVDLKEKLSFQESFSRSEWIFHSSFTSHEFQLGFRCDQPQGFDHRSRIGPLSAALWPGSLKGPGWDSKQQSEWGSLRKGPEALGYRSVIVAAGPDDPHLCEPCGRPEMGEETSAAFGDIWLRDML